MWLVAAVLLLKPLIGQIPRWDEALYIGWFGPIGVGALYFAAVAHKETQLAQVWAVATLLVAASIVAHDLTATPLSRWLSKRGVADGQQSRSVSQARDVPGISEDSPAAQGG